MPNHEEQRVVGAWGLLWGQAILVAALVVMVVAATFFATGLREGYIETGGSPRGCSRCSWRSSSACSD